MRSAAPAARHAGRLAALSRSNQAPKQALALLLLGTLVLAVLAWTGAHAAPQGAASLGQGFLKPSQAGRGELLYRDKEGGAWRAVPTLSTEVEIGIGGVSARVALVQRFKNATAEWLEGIYVFPLPETAAVDSLRLRIGDREIEGRVAERQQAKKEYAEARDTGRRASLVEQERANIFTASVANIAPG